MITLRLSEEKANYEEAIKVIREQFPQSILRVSKGLQYGDDF